MAATAVADRSRAAGVAAVLAVVMTAGGLVIYKATGALKVLAKASTDHALGPKPRWIDVGDAGASRPVLESLNYLSWIAIALLFGIAIGATVRAFVPQRWLERTVAGSGVRGQLVAALVGAPLMLCSCCIAPVFEGVYARTRRLGPALGLMLAAPTLNPAVLAATFLIFPARMAWTRLVVGLALVLLGGLVLGRVERDVRTMEPCAIDGDGPSARGFLRAFGSSLGTVAWRSLPAILLGVIASAAIAGWIPLDHVTREPMMTLPLVVIVALIAVPIALPTFGEIPLALALLAAGAPLGAATALLVAGPSINLPSLFTLARATSWRVAAATAVTVFAAAVAAGFAVELTT